MQHIFEFGEKGPKGELHHRTWKDIVKKLKFVKYLGEVQVQFYLYHTLFFKNSVVFLAHLYIYVLVLVSAAQNLALF